MSTSNDNCQFQSMSCCIVAVTFTYSCTFVLVLTKTSGCILYIYSYFHPLDTYLIFGIHIISVLASTRGDLGEAKLSCKPDMKAPPNNRFLKCEPQYPHELRGEAKLSCKKVCIVCQHTILTNLSKISKMPKNVFYRHSLRHVAEE